MIKYLCKIILVYNPFFSKYKYTSKGYKKYPNPYTKRRARKASHLRITMVKMYLKTSMTINTNKPKLYKMTIIT